MRHFSLSRSNITTLAIEVVQSTVSHETDELLSTGPVGIADRLNILQVSVCYAKIFAVTYTKVIQMKLE